MRSRIGKDFWLFNVPIAHRGLHGNGVCENSMSAYSLAIERGYPIEMDVQMTKDGELVCFHDDNLRRVTGCDGFVRDKTYAQLQELNLGGTNDKIPLFSDFLSLVGGRVPLLIEIKPQKEKGIEKKVLNALKNYGGQYVLQSFDPMIMGRIKKLDNRVIRGQLGGDIKSIRPNYKRLCVKNLWLNFISSPDFINYNFEALPRKFNKPVICYTIRTDEQRAHAEKYALGYVFEDILP